MQGSAKPLEQHLNDGTYRADRHGDESEHFRPSGSLERPDGLCGVAGELWDKLSADLVVVGRRIDSVALASACEWYAVYRDAIDRVRKNGTAAKGSYKAQTQAAMAWKQFDSIAKRFGLTPLDRLRLRGIGPAKNDADDRMGFLSERLRKN